MEVDVAVLGGGPGGYTAAIRAAQLGARVACIEREPELGGTCLRIGCIPTKAWVQTAFALKQAEETFGKLGVTLDGPKFEFPVANEWKAAAVRRMTRGVAYLFKANGVQWIRGTGTFTGANTLTVDGQEVSFRSAIIATGSYPVRPPIQGLDSDRCVDSEQLLAQTEVPARLVILGGGVIGCEFASIFGLFGSEVAIIEMFPSLIPQEDADASGELAKQFRRRGITLHLGQRCTKVEDSGSELTVHFGDGQTAGADLMLVATGRGPLVHGLGLEQAGVRFDRRTGIAADARRRTSVPHIYAVGDCAGYWQLAHTAFRERGGGGAECVRARRHGRRPRRAAPDLHRPGDRQRRPHRGPGTRAAWRRRRDGDVPVDRERPGRDAERDGRLGEVDPHHLQRRTARPGHDRPARDRHDRGWGRRDRLERSGRDRRRRHGTAPDPVGGHQGRRSRCARPGDRRPEPETGPATRIHDEHHLSLQPT
jgi:pyruvate/2-oxoglutarate dehydrogenase complex dihydrolipoamide dehydrogenase (E3) component